jgi:hypothetical protein
MNQRSIYTFLNKQRFSAVVIYEQFVIIFGSDTIAYLVFMKHLREMK